MLTCGRSSNVRGLTWKVEESPGAEETLSILLEQTRATALGPDSSLLPLFHITLT